MYNWSVDEQYFQKHDPEGHKIWRLLQLINYGLDGEKIDKKELIKYWPQIKDFSFEEIHKKLAPNYPKMIRSLKKTNLIRFFQKEAKKFENEILLNRRV